MVRIRPWTTIVMFLWASCILSQEYVLVIRQVMFRVQKYWRSYLKIFHQSIFSLFGLTITSAFEQKIRKIFFFKFWIRSRLWSWIWSKISILNMYWFFILASIHNLGIFCKFWIWSGNLGAEQHWLSKILNFESNFESAAFKRRFWCGETLMLDQGSKSITRA